MPNYRPSGTDEWSSSGFQSAINMQDAQAKDMDGQFVAGNLVEPIDFINEYLPATGEPPVIEPFAFSDDAITNEETWAKEANKLCKTLKIHDTLEFFDTHNAGSQSYGESRRPDLTAVFRGKLSETKKPLDVVDSKIRKELVATNFRELFRYAAFIIERKLASQDGFIDTDAGTQAKLTQTSKRVRGQLICYNLHHFREQPRIFSFQILLIHNFARLIRWDRAGAIVTEAFDWTKGTLLATFLSRFASASRKQRGLDTTVRAATADEIKVLQGACKKETLPVPSEPYWVYEVVDEPDDMQEDSDALSDLSSLTSSSASTHEAETAPPSAHDARSRSEAREFVVGRPLSYPRAFTGRTSTGYVAYDVQDRDLSYLKDAWYPDHPDIVPEGRIYRRLQPGKDEKRCPFIPELVCAGDVYDADGKRQETLSQRRVPADLQKNSRIRQYTHTRTVVRDVGVPMPAFKTVSDLLQLLCDTLDAHRYATERHILHRDISPSNIMINRRSTTARALLADWDLALDMSKPPSTSDEHFITGTWQFMSIMLLKHDENHQHDAHDDLESMFWVLCYCLVRYTNLHPGSDVAAQVFLHDTFDNSRNVIVPKEGQSEQRKGGSEKMALLEEVAVGMSDDMQPPDMAEALGEVFGNIHRPLLDHVRLRNLERAVAAGTRRPPTDQRSLNGVKKDLKDHRDAISRAAAAFGYASLRTLFETALTAMQKWEASFLSSISSFEAPRGSLRVADRYGRKLNNGTDGEGDNEIERAERQTRGGVKRGSDHDSEEGPQPKIPRPATPGQTRSGHSAASASFRSALPAIVDNSPLKGKTASVGT